MLLFDRDIAVIKLEPFDTLEELWRICSQLSRMTATGELKGVVLDLQGNDDLTRNLGEPLICLHMIRRRSRKYHGRDFDQNPFVVLCNTDPSRFEGKEENIFVLFFSFADSVENGIAKILNHHDVFPGPLEERSPISNRGRSRIFAAGCTEKDLSDIPDQLRDAGYEVADSAAHTVSDGDHVIFCISCAHGPTDGTIRSILNCSGKEIVPVCIFKNFSDLVVYDSLMELVSMEMDELLSKILPKDLIGSLPSFYDFDLDLPSKIADRLKLNLKSIRCK